MYTSRKTQNKLGDAIRDRRGVVAGNSAVVCGHTRVAMIVHRSTVFDALYENESSAKPYTLTLDFCGYNTRLTADRLQMVCNALELPICASIRGGVGAFYLHGEYKNPVATGSVEIRASRDDGGKRWIVNGVDAGQRMRSFT